MKIDKDNLSTEIKDKYDIVNETFVRKDKGEVAEEREIEIGDLLSEEFQPQVKLKQWDNECNFSVRMIDDEPDEPHIETEGNKIKFIKNKTKCHFYKEGNNFKFVPILKKKPKTNKIEMNIESKGLKFYYQPALTEEYQSGYSEEFKKEIIVTETDVKDLDGNVLVHRSENIVGSYAVYHESKSGDYSKMGLKNYRVGKAFDIYRPRLKDSNGWEVWGDLLIDAENGIYRITIPTDFYENAVYPIKSNDTFGYTSVGGSYGYGIRNNIAGVIGSPVSSGTATKISVATQDWDAGDAIKCALYDDSDDSFVANSGTEERTSGGADATFHDFTFSTNPSVDSAVTYAIVGWADDNSYPAIKYDSSSPDNNRRNDSTTYAAEWPASLSFNVYTQNLSIYATYTAGGAAGNLKSSNTVTLANIKSKNSVLIANIKNINGVTTQ